MKKNCKTKNLRDTYREQIIKNHIFKRNMRLILAILFISTFLWIIYDHINSVTTVFTSNVICNICCSIILLCLMLLWIAQSQSKQKKYKDLDKLRFEYEQYLDREKMRKNHLSGELTLDDCTDHRFRFD